MAQFDLEQDRRGFVDFLIDSGVGGLIDNPEVNSFIESTGDVALESLMIDSLALMEIGIGIEDLYEVSLSPNSISRYTSLNELWSAVVRVS